MKFQFHARTIAVVISMLLVLLVWLVPARGEAFESEAGVQAAAIGGNLVDVRQYPWFVYYVSEFGACGGCLIAPQVVLTAHHCEPQVGKSVKIGYKDPSPSDLKKAETDMLAFMAKNNIASPDPATWTPRQLELMKTFRETSMAQYGEFRTITRVIPHPKTDLALVILDAPSTKPPIRLASRLPPMNSAVTSIGRGFNQKFDPNKPLPEALRKDLPLTKVVLQMVSGKQIVDEPGYIVTRSRSTISPCRGDSGGPLFVTKNGQHELIGIVQRGSVYGGCFKAVGKGALKDTVFGIFGDVTYHAAWIARHMATVK
jgi:hypothetical protein